MKDRQSKVIIEEEVDLDVKLEGVSKQLIGDYESLRVDHRLLSPDYVHLLECTICMEIFKNPHQCKNGHVFCYDCIKGHIDRRRQCPVCRCELQLDQLSRSLITDRFIDELMVYCKYFYILKNQEEEEEDGVGDGNEGVGDDNEYKVDVMGCTEVMKYGHSKIHEGTCPLAWTECKYNGNICGMFRRRDIETHQQKCQYRTLECEFCHLQFHYKQLDVCYQSLIITFLILYTYISLYYRYHHRHTLLVSHSEMQT